MIGETLGGRYLILKLLGQGGMGAVYEATHTGTDRRVAVKVITAGLDVRPAIVARFEVEARAAGKVESRHIAQVLDVGRDERRGVPYLVMEYLTGEDVQQTCRRLGPLPPVLAVRIVAQACRGLEKAHAAGIIHRDIKPANLFLTQQDEDAAIIKLLDFGVAKIRQGDPTNEDGESVGSLTSTGSLLGSPLYMSPEQARGIKQIDHRTDLWSLGVVLYQLLSGRTPFQHIEAMGDLIISLCSTPAPPLQEFAPWVPAEIAAIVHHALEIPVDRRFQTAREFYEALKPLLQGSINIEPHLLAAMPDDERSFVAPRAGSGITSITGPGAHMISGSGTAVISGTSNPGFTSNPGATSNPGFKSNPGATSNPGGISSPGMISAPGMAPTAVTSAGVKPRRGAGLLVVLGIAALAAVSAAVVVLRGPAHAEPAASSVPVAAEPQPTAPSAHPSASAAPAVVPSAPPSASASAAPSAEPAAPEPSAAPQVAAPEPPSPRGPKLKGPLPKASAKPAAGPAPEVKTVGGRPITTDL